MQFRARAPGPARLWGLGQRPPGPLHLGLLVYTAPGTGRPKPTVCVALSIGSGSEPGPRLHTQCRGMGTGRHLAARRTAAPGSPPEPQPHSGLGATAGLVRSLA